MSNFDDRDENREFNEGREIRDGEMSFNENNNGKKKKKSKALAGTMAVAIAASLIGGGIGGAGVYAVMDSKEDVKIEKEHEGVEPVSVPQFKESGTMTTAEAVKAVTPAVVGVSTKSIVQDNFFNGATEQEGIGSGFIISEDGLVVTNYHVINGATEVKVILSDGTEVAAKVVNFDKEADLAVIDITEDIKMPGVAKLGDSSKLQAGEDVIAIGNPLGKEFSKTVTKGIISSPNRELSVSGNPEMVETFIQTDAAINPGNSGGPLINANGEVIGVNTAKKVGEEIEGIGFSIPINTVKEKLGTLSKPNLLLGIDAMNIDEELSKSKNVPVGVRIMTVRLFGPAELAGLQRGDIITEYNGKKVTTINELNELKSTAKENEVVKLTIFRDGETLKVDVKLKSEY